MNKLLSLFIILLPFTGKAQEQTPVSVATIYVYRTHAYTGVIKGIPIYLDQTEVVRLQDREGVRLIVPAGQHTVHQKMKKGSSLFLDTKQGQTYYVRAKFNGSGFAVKIDIDLVDPLKGQYEFSQLGPTVTRDLTATQGMARAEETNRTTPLVPATALPIAVAASAVEGTATLSVTTTPDGAEIYADGTFVGNAPASLKLPAGKHTIRVTQSDYKDWSREITVQAGSGARLVATLEKKVAP